MLKRTPLFECHQALGARLVEFGGWEMPVQYSSIIDEHKQVRTASGVFDIAHMGEVLVSGPGSLAFLNHLLTNDAGKLSPGLGQYSLLCNPAGGVVDDLYLYQLEPDRYLLIINASRIEADLSWIRLQLQSWTGREQVELEDASGRLGAIALQGPKSRSFIDALPGSVRGTGKKASLLKKNEIGSFEFEGLAIWIACTGYTGEDGFEIIAPNEVLSRCWNQLLKAGEVHGIKPCGLGARDTLRLEACYPLYGHELDEKTTPIEAGLGFFVALEKGEFIGRDVLSRQKAEGVGRKCVAFQMAGASAPPRAHYPIWVASQPAAAVGEITSGSQSPTLNVGIGMGYVPVAFSKPGFSLEVEIRGRKFPATVVKKPFYRMKV